MGKYHEQSMKKYLLSLLFISLLLFPADTFAGAKTKIEVLSYMTSLPSQSSKKILSGQFIGWCTENDTLFTNIYAKSGKYPALMSGDYADFGCPTGADLITYNAYLKAHWAAGGLIEVAWHADNPVTMEWDHTTPVNLVDLIKNGTTTNTNWKAMMDRVAIGLQDLKDNGVVVIFRPFLEMNGDWFWWGNKDGTEFKNAWIYTYNYLTTTKGLNNLLWAFSYNNNYGAAASTYYPGYSYVDITGVDAYPESQTGEIGAISDYSYLSGLGKPFALTEVGVCNYLGCPSPQNLSDIISDIKTYAPNSIYWNNWDDTWSMDYGTNVSTLLNDPWVVNRSDNPSGAAGSGPTIQNRRPSPPSGFSIQ